MKIKHYAYFITVIYDPIVEKEQITFFLSIAIGEFLTHVGGTFYCINRICGSIGSCTSAADVRVSDQSHCKKARGCTRESQARAIGIQAHSKYILSILRLRDSNHILQINLRSAIRKILPWFEHEIDTSKKRTYWWCSVFANVLKKISI